MPIAYEKAKKPVVALLEKVMADYHPILVACEVKVDVLMVSNHDAEGGRVPDAIKLHGYPCLAVIKTVPLKQRVLDQGDVLLSIDEWLWQDLSDEQKIAALDHELEHLDIASEGGGVLSVDPETGDMVGMVKADDIGRPVIKMKLHDWQLGGFKNIAKRHGDSAIEVQQANECRDDKGQFFWEWEEIRTPSIRPVERKASTG